MSFSFAPQHGLVIIRTEIEGSLGKTALRLALDTGATRTAINTYALAIVGCYAIGSADRGYFATGSGVESAPRVTVPKLRALGQTREGLSVLCHALPPSTGIDGVLGLDFFRGRCLTIDFRKGRITLA